MDDIAKSCGMSKKTLYEQVVDKNDLVEQVVFAEFEDGKTGPHGADIKNKNAIETLFLVYKGAMEFFKDYNFSMEFDLKKYYPGLYKKARKERRKRFYDKMHENMTKGRIEGFFREDFNIDIVAKIHIIKIETLLETDIFEKDEYSTIDIFKEIFLYHVHGIATPKGLEELQFRIKEYEQQQNQ